MLARHPDLQRFLRTLDAALKAADLEPEAIAAIDRIWKALESPAAAGSSTPKRLPVCRCLEETYARARSKSPHIDQLVEAFAAIEPTLSWGQRASSGPFASDNWPEGHANAMIVGPGGVEDRTDLWIGVSLMAPHVRYPDHSHPPEEVYLVLSPGRFQHGESGWFEPGIGGTLYNEPKIRHAMASDDFPLLAFWCLWSGSPI